MQKYFTTSVNETTHKSKSEALKTKQILKEIIKKERNKKDLSFFCSAFVSFLKETKQTYLSLMDVFAFSHEAVSVLYCLVFPTQ